MRILLAPAQFKESMSAMDAAKCWSKVLTKAGHNCLIQPISDGGEGFVDAFRSTDSESVIVSTLNPLGEAIASEYVIREGVAVIEMARASGIELVPPEKRDPNTFTTYGTGLLIRDAIDRGIQKIVVGMGGSATNDGGIGVFLALGGRILDEHGNDIRSPLQIKPNSSLDYSGFPKFLPEIIAATDVENPLLGEEGASFVFGPQKGLIDPWRADQRLGWWADLVEDWRGKSFRDVPGSGAAGGLGFGLLGLLEAQIVPGFTLVRDVTKIDEILEGVDAVVTGEGKMDYQSAYGKAPYRLMHLCQEHGIPVYAIVGLAEGRVHSGFTKIYQLARMAGSVKEAIDDVERWMSLAAQTFANDLRR